MIAASISTIHAGRCARVPRRSLLGIAVAAVLLIPSAAFADCNVDAATGNVDCGTTTTVAGGPVDVNGVPATYNGNEYLFNTSVAMTGTIDSGAAISGSGAWFEQDALGSTLSVLNNGSVLNSTPCNGLEGFGNGGLVSYSGNGSAIQTDRSNEWAGLALFNRNNGGINVGSAAAPVTGTFEGITGLYAGPRGGTTDVVGDVNIFLDGGQVIGLAATDPANTSAGISTFLAGGSGNSFIQTTGHTFIHTPEDGVAILGYTGSGNSTIISDAMIGTATNVVGEGLRAHVTEGAGDAEADGTGGSIYASFYGIRAGADGTGTATASMTGDSETILVTGTASNAIPASGIRTDATSGASLIDVDAVGGGVSAPNGYGLYMTSTSGNMTIFIGPQSYVRGGVAAIDINTVSGTSIIDTGGVTGAANAKGVAIEQNAGSALIGNEGLLLGTLQLAGTTGQDVFYNQAGWASSGTSHFGSGETMIENIDSGTIRVSDCSAGCALDFGGSQLDRLVNGGQMVLGGAATDRVAFNFDGNAGDVVDNYYLMQVTGTVTFNGLANLNNRPYGILDMRQNGPGNHNSDSMSVSGNFNGLGGILGVDAFLGGTGSTADMLHVGGAVSGTTPIVVADTNNGGGGLTGPGGIPIVTVAGASSAGSFVLDPGSSILGGAYENVNGTGVLEKGAFDYYLARSQAGTFALVSAPDQTAAQAPVALVGAQSIWYETAQSWQDRSDTTTTTGGADSGFWSSVVGTRTRHNTQQAFSSGALAVNYDLDYDQNVWGMLLGYEASVRGSGPDALRLGVMAGYAGAELKFDSSAFARLVPSDFHYSGGLLGATATYRNGDFFADALLKVDLLRVRFDNVPTGDGGFQIKTVPSRTWGAMGNVGVHYQLGSAFIDPLFTLAGTRSDIGSLALPATPTSLKFRNDSTLRAAIGARIGSVFAYGSHGSLTGSLTGRFWDQFTGDSPGVAVADAASESDTSDHFKGAFGEVSGRLDWNCSSGMDVWLQAGAKFNNEFTTNSLKLGMRWMW